MIKMYQRHIDVFASVSYYVLGQHSHGVLRLPFETAQRHHSDIDPSGRSQTATIVQCALGNFIPICPHAEAHSFETPHPHPFLSLSLGRSLSLVFYLAIALRDPCYIQKRQRQQLEGQILREEPRMVAEELKRRREVSRIERVNLDGKYNGVDIMNACR